MRILVSGGGTGGHISPTLATLDVLKQLDKDLEVLYVGQKGGLERRVAAGEGWQFATITAGKYRHGPSRKLRNNISNLSIIVLNLRDLFKAAIGLVQSLILIRRFRPAVVFVKGGYVGLPVGMAARLLRRPLVIHESDIEPGLTNQFLSKYADVIATGFPTDSYKKWQGRKLVYTGIPFREQILKAHRLEGIAKFKLEPDLPVILVTGGSQGAASINRAVVGALPELVKRYQVLHIAGEKQIEQVRFEVGRKELPRPEHYHLFAFLLTEMGEALAAADVVVGRAGATTLAELAALGKPAVLIPNNLMAAHQLANARLLSRAGAARVIQEEKLSSSSLVHEIDFVMNSAEEQARLTAAIKQFAVPDAAERLARLILNSARAEPAKVEEAVGPGSDNDAE